MHSLQVTLLLVTLMLVPACAADPQFRGARALRYTEKAVSYGPRPSGTEALAKLQDYLTSELRDFNCQVSYDSFTARTPVGELAMRNIIARAPGKSGKTIVLTGHYDTKIMKNMTFIGANDGGSSTGLLLELARVLCGRENHHEIVLVWFDGEEATVEWTAEDSLYGSRHLAAKWAEEGSLARIKALINVDMTGDKDLDLLFDLNSTAWLRTLVWDMAAQSGQGRHFPRQASAVGDDHLPFLQKGVAALDLIDFNYGPSNSYWHTEHDTLDKLSAESFQIMGDLLLQVVRKLEED